MINWKLFTNQKHLKTGDKILEIENTIKEKFGKEGYFTQDEMEDGFTETIPYNKKNIDYIKSLLKKIK